MNDYAPAFAIPKPRWTPRPGFAKRLVLLGPSVLALLSALTVSSPPQQHARPHPRPPVHACVAVSANPLSMQAARIAYKTGFRGHGLIMAVAISGAESSWRTEAEGHNYNGTIDYGIWQINSIHLKSLHVTGADLHNPGINARAAYIISGGGTSWHPWTTFVNGRYLQRLAAAEETVQALMKCP